MIKIIKVLDYRTYGSPKLKSPIELKGIKKSFSVKFYKASCYVYIKDANIYIKHRDYFSDCISYEEAKARGIEVKQRKKFIYNDNFGSVVLRNEAWIMIEDYKQYIDEPYYIMLPKLVEEFLDSINMEQNDSCRWERFFEEVFKGIQRV